MVIQRADSPNRHLIVIGIVLISICSAPALAQKVYKCHRADGSVEYTNIACTAEAEPIQFRDSNFGGSSRSAEMRLENTSCLLRAGYAVATGWAVNATDTPRQARVTATFTNRGSVVETTSRNYAIAAFDRSPFEIIGPRTATDACQYDMTWE